MPAASKSEYYRSIATPLALYVLTLLLFLGASFDTSIRLWGINAWAYLPVAVRVGLFLYGLAMGGALVYWLAPRQGSSSLERKEWNVIWRSIFLLMTISLVAGFVLLRARAHYLGDGYSLLSGLAQGELTLKSRDFGTTLVLNLIRDAMPGSAEGAALWTYQFVAVVSGVALVVLVWWSAARLFDRVWTRVLFALGVCTGGYMLFFFGYVENYAVRCVAVAAFTLVGVQVARGTMHRLWVIPLLIGALLTHLTTIALIPAALFLLVSDTKWAGRIGTLGLIPRLGLSVLILAVGVAGFQLLAERWLYFQLAFVPPWPTQFTVGGYTLFALRHVGDVVNLVLLLVPGILVLVAGRSERRDQGRPPRRDLAFLRLLVGTTLVVTFLLDPKLGMPRDWDLFAFAGVPLAVFLFLTVLDASSGLPRRAVTAALAISVGVLSLLPRAWIQSQPALAVEQARDFVRYDPRRSRVALNLIGQRAQASGDTATVIWAQQTLGYHFKDDLWLQLGTRALAQGDAVTARERARAVVMLDPTRPAGWLLLAKTHRANATWDSALAAARVADGLNPNSAPVLTELGIAHLNRGESEPAEARLLEAVDLAPGVALGWRALAMVADQRGDLAKRHEYLLRAASCEDAEIDLVLALIRSHVDRSEFPEAAWTLKRYVARTHDTARVRRLLEEYPDLAREYRP